MIPFRVRDPELAKHIKLTPYEYPRFAREMTQEEKNESKRTN